MFPSDRHGVQPRLHVAQDPQRLVYGASIATYAQPPSPRSTSGTLIYLAFEQHDVSESVLVHCS